MIEAIRQYLGELEAEFKRGNATEHSCRPALKKFIESHGKTVHAVNEPRRVECGAPDFEVSRGTLKVAKGYPKFIVDGASCSVQEEQRALTAQTKLEAPSTKGRVQINETQYFDGVPSKVWNFTIGGYQVCEKWLKDRRGRTLALDDVRHYQKIVIALRRTDELMQEIDASIPKWPIE